MTSQSISPSLFCSVQRQHRDKGPLPQDSSSSFLRSQVPSTPDARKKIEKQIVHLEKDKLQQNLEFYGWRNKTQIPIAKVYTYKALKKNEPIPNRISYQVSYEAPFMKLSDFTGIPLFQILYLMKESLIGYQRLYSLYEAFRITKEMILVNKSNKCKVWLSRNLAENYPDQILPHFAEPEFLGQILNIFDSICIETKLSKEFFIAIRQRQKIIEAIEFIEMFASSKKIIIPSCLNLQTTISNPFSPSKMTGCSKIWNKNQNINESQITRTNTESFINEKSGRIATQASRDSPTKASTKKFPTFFSKKSGDLEKRISYNPQVHGLVKSKSYQHFKNLKQSTITISKMDTSKKDVQSTSNDGSISRVTTRSQKNLPKSLLTPPSSIKTPNHKKGKKSDFSFRKEVSDDEDGPETFEKAERGWKTFTDDDQTEPKSRKYSTEFNTKRDFQENYGIKVTTPNPKLRDSDTYDQSKLTGSQPIVTVSSPISPKKTFLARKNTLQNLVIDSPETAITKSNEEGTSKKNGNIFEKNGWTMQLNTLIGSDISMRESIGDGKDQRSELLGKTSDFEMLGRLGRAIQGSMTPDEEPIQFNN